MINGNQWLIVGLRTDADGIEDNVQHVWGFPFKERPCGAVKFYHIDLLFQCHIVLRLQEGIHHIQPEEGLEPVNNGVVHGALETFATFTSTQHVRIWKGKKRQKERKERGPETRIFIVDLRKESLQGVKILH